MKIKNKYIIICLCFIGITLFSSPVLAQTYCWPKADCEKAGGTWADKEKTNCMQSPTKYSYCYPKEAKIDLQVSIGDLKKTGSLIEYIPAVYNYAVSIVSIIAVIMIMVGGLKYLTAGGAQDKVTSAKNTILGAVVGLFLVFGANLLLRTINPDLIELKLPKVKMVAPQSISQWCPDEEKYKCGEKYTETTTVKSPKGISYCFGQYCKINTGQKKQGCFKPSYDATDKPKCILEKAGKACDRIKKDADDCLNTAAPTSAITCVGKKLITMPKEALYAGKISYNLSNYNILELRGPNNNNVWLKHGGSTDFFTGINEIDNGFQIALCKNGKIGCDGPEKDLIDALCGWLEKLPPGNPILDSL